MTATGSPGIVCILLSTFNGAAFLPEQLASFDSQRGTGWCLYWRDDGSTDDSVAIMEDYAARTAGCVRVGPVSRLGVTASYMVLLRQAVADGMGPVAFADQDDVWLPGKLARGMAQLAGSPGPALYCSRQFLVDGELRPLGLSEPIRVPPGLCPALTQNIATGCTVMLDCDAAALVARSVPPNSTLHDWWSYLVVSGAGGRVVADAEPTVNYRQHALNAVGAPLSKRKRAVAALRRGPGTYMRLLRAHLAALRDQPALLSRDGLATVTEVGAALESGLLSRLLVLRRFGLLRQTKAETWLFRCWFLVG